MTDTENGGGFSRRDMLKRSAVVGGAVLWTTPVVQSLASPAFAAGTGCKLVLLLDPDGNSATDPCFILAEGEASPTCCECLMDDTVTQSQVLQCAPVCFPITFNVTDRTGDEVPCS
jgi:hypothetical protein